MFTWAYCLEDLGRSDPPKQPAAIFEELRTMTRDLLLSSPQVLPCPDCRVTSASPGTSPG